MKKNFVKKVMAAGLSAAMMITSMTGLAMAEPVSEENVQAAVHRIWVVGDSTVCDYTKDAEGTLEDATYYYPRYGYATQLANYFDDEYEVVNIALSGRSSLSFLGESNYNVLKKGGEAKTTGGLSLGTLEGIKAGDVLVIGFGHNDEKAESDRYTNPNGDVDTKGSFQKNLYDNYVKLAEDAGATAVLCTPVCRRNPSGVLSNADAHITKDAKDTYGNEYPGGDYAQAIRDLAAAKNVPLVDLTAMTKDLYTTIGAGAAEVTLDETDPENLKPIYSGVAEGSMWLHAWANYKPASVDNTHLNIYGAKMVSYLFAKSVKETASPLAAHVKADISEPTKDADLTVNPSYKVKLYRAPADDAKSMYFDNYTTGDLTFRGTIFGDCGYTVLDDTQIANVKALYAPTVNADGSLTMECGGKGKIAGTADGIFVYYIKVPSAARFKFSAKAKISKMPADKQSAFGIMVRDDMYIDSADKSIGSDYVVAGTMGGEYLGNCFYRKAGAIGGKVALTGTIEKGEEYLLSVEKNADGFACKIGDEPVQTGGYDFQLTSVDPEYQYICLMAARTVKVTYSDIKFECLHQVVSGNYIENTEVSCTEDGVKKYVCAGCGETITETVAALGHDWSEEVIEAPTFEKEGTLKKTCKRCTATATEPIAKLVNDKPVPYEDASSTVKASNTDTLELGKGTDKKGNNIAKLTAKAVGGKATVLVKSKITVTGLDGDVEIKEGSEFVKTKFNARKNALTIQASKPGKAVIKYPNGAEQTYVIVKPEIAKEIKKQTISKDETAVVTVSSGQSAEGKDDGINAYKWTVKGGKSQSVDEKTGEIVVLDKAGEEVARISTSGSTAKVKAVGSGASIKLTAQYLNKKFTAAVKINK